MVMIAVARFQEDIPACFYLEFASSPPSCSAIIAAMMRVRLPKFGVQKTCAVAKCQILLHVLFFANLTPVAFAANNIISHVYGQAKPPAKAFFRAGSTSELRSYHLRMSAFSPFKAHQGYLFRRNTRNNISMLSKATEMFDIPFRGPHQLEDDDYERVNALFDSICWFADYETKCSVG